MDLHREVTRPPPRWPGLLLLLGLGVAMVALIVGPFLPRREGGCESKAHVALRRASQIASTSAARHAVDGTCDLDHGALGLRKTDTLRDPWGSAYEIICREDLAVVRSAGEDRKLGTSDDIVAASVSE